MTWLALRRSRNLLLTVLLMTLIGVWFLRNPLSVPGINFVTGWGLIGLTLVLALFNLRKKLSFLPLGSAAGWMQLHLYLGLLAVWVFLLHTRASLPSGPFDTSLYLLFALTAITGLAGIWLSRWLPRQLRQWGEEVTFNLLPRRIAEVQQRVEEHLLTLDRDAGGEGLLQLHAHTLGPWLDGPRDRLEHLIGSDAPERRIFQRIRELERYLSQAELDTLAEILPLLHDKLALDRRHARLWILRRWLLLHLPLAGLLLFFALMHLILVHAFVGLA